MNNKKCFGEGQNNQSFSLLYRMAMQAKENAYAPYSNFKVGAALVTSSGRTFTGCNVENASFGLTICAERNAIGSMLASGEKQIEALLVVGDIPNPLAPCGACRQVIAEFAHPNCIIWMCGLDNISKETTLREILPFQFILENK